MYTNFSADIVNVSTMIAKHSATEAEVFPIDRQFLLPYLDTILSLNRNDFLLYNLETMPSTYVIKLFLSLPELWEDITVDDIIQISSRFRNILSFFGLILFTYKYIEINIIELLLRLKFDDKNFKSDIKMFMSSQYPNFFKSDIDWFYFEKGVYGDSIETLIYAKQRFLLDDRVLPAFQTPEEFGLYLSSLKY